VSDEGRRRSRAGGVVCDHCGLPVPPSLVREGEEKQFCCGGCRQVYAILHDWGLDGFYRQVEREGAELGPARVSGRRFDDFDAEELVGEQVKETEGGTRRTRLFLEGVHCAACVWLVEELPRALDGVLSVRLNLASAVADVEWDPKEVRLSSIARALDSIGYTPHLRDRVALEDARRHEDRVLLTRIGVAAACAMNIMFIHGALYSGEDGSMDASFVQFFRWLSLGLAVPVVFYSARPFFRAAWAGLRQRVPHMDLPIAVALGGAFLFSAIATITGDGPIYFDSLAGLVALLLGARFVQQRAQRTALERAEGLRSVAFVEFARRLGANDGEGLEVPSGVLAVGDRVEVRSGELIPVDGEVVRGRSNVDNAVLTGEPAPVPVAPGDEVFAGATNLGAPLVVETRARGAGTRVGGLLALVDDALATRAPIVKLADRISRWFVLAVLVLGIAAGATALWWRGGDLRLAMQQVVAMLVVTCPCALGLATPVALTVGLSRAARAGIFIKNPDVVEQLHRVETAFLDKTGTLTVGKPTVERWEGDPRAVELAFALEEGSAHPVAQAFRRSSLSPCAAVETVDVKEVPGRGITGRVGGHAVAVGSEAFLRELGVPLPEAFARHGRALVEAGLSPIHVVVDGELAAVGGVGDALRSDARETVRELVARGVRPRILSGDHPAVVTSIARELGLPEEDALGGMSPEEKRDLVAEAVAERDASGGRGRFLMVGDGVNDAAALALADVGVAVEGGAGASILAADVVLTRPGLRPLFELWRGSRRVLRIIHRNLAFSLLYNLVGATLALVGLVGPLLAALLMPVSSLTVILSSVLGRSFEVPDRREGRSVLSWK